MFAQRLSGGEWVMCIPTRVPINEKLCEVSLMNAD